MDQSMTALVENGSGAALRISCKMSPTIYRDGCIKRSTGEPIDHHTAAGDPDPLMMLLILWQE